MAPTKSTRNALTTKHQIPAIPTVMIATTTRKTSRRHGDVAENVELDQNMEVVIQTRGKRKAENSPMKNGKIKRSALSNLTNNEKITCNNNNAGDDDVTNKKQSAFKKDDVISIQHQTQTQVLKDMKTATTINITNNINNNYSINNDGNLQYQMQTKIMTRAAAARNNAIMKPLEEIKKSKTKTEVNNSILGTAPTNHNKIKKGEELAPPAAPIVAHGNHGPVIKLPNKPTRRISNEFNKSEDSLYISALEDVSTLEKSRLSGNFERRSGIFIDKSKAEKLEIAKKFLIKVEETVVTPPEGVEDFDRKNWNDPYQVSHYAMDIFEYLKSREKDFIIDDYMSRQIHLTKSMRSVLVDWMVEVQETFELNHETLYLAVKIVDLYLSRVILHKDKLQLLGAASLFISCKFDERTPPLVDDFLYICDGAYNHKEIIQMEMTVLRAIDFDLGVPLSYRFLRRYARCGRVPLPTLTLARYILELSLMDYATIGLSDSRSACAALFMALRMHGNAKPWTLTFEYYTGYKVKDFAFVVPIMNDTLHRKPKSTIETIFNKYSHKIFHEVAKVPRLSVPNLFKEHLTAEEIQKL